MSETASLVEKLRKCAKTFLEKRQIPSALFWMDKLMSLSSNAPEDVFVFGKCLYASGEYPRCIKILANYGLLAHSEAARHLAAQCLCETEEYELALRVLDRDAMHVIAGTNELNNLISARVDSSLDEQLPKEYTEGLEADIYLLRGKIHEALESVQLAANYYKLALQKNVLSYEAYEKLARFQCSGLYDVVLPSRCEVRKQVDEDLAELVEFFYRRQEQTQAATSLELMPIPSSLSVLRSNLDVASMCAERLFAMCQYHQCLEITTSILESDPYHMRSLPMHISLLKVMGLANDLYKLSHDLIRYYSQRPISWFAIGNYYMCIRRFEVARKHLTKATQLDRNFTSAWLALGHAFSAQNERDHALTAYFKAARVVADSSIPMLYIGVEYRNGNNLELADTYLREAHRRAPENAVTLHELGNLNYDCGKYQVAYDFFLKAYQLVKERTNGMPEPFWEPLLNNLGHTSQKLGHLDTAVQYHEMALAILPNNVTSLNALACALLIKADAESLERAMKELQRSLRLDPRDSVSSELHRLCVDKLMASRDALMFQDSEQTENDASVGSLSLLSRGKEEQNWTMTRSQDGTLPSVSEVHMDLE